MNCKTHFVETPATSSDEKSLFDSSGLARPCDAIKQQVAQSRTTFAKNYDNGVDQVLDVLNQKLAGDE
jgi:hypothetical protein